MGVCYWFWRFQFACLFITGGEWGIWDQGGWFFNWMDGWIGVFLVDIMDMDRQGELRASYLVYTPFYFCLWNGGSGFHDNGAETESLGMERRDG